MTDWFLLFDELEQDLLYYGEYIYKPKQDSKSMCILLQFSPIRKCCFFIRLLTSKRKVLQETLLIQCSEIKENESVYRGAK